MAIDEITEDRFLDGRVMVRQPRHGYRAAMDPVLLAAAAPILRKGRVLDLGAGVGTAALCYGVRVANVSLSGLELQPDLVELARQNIALNDLEARMQMLKGDLMQPPEGLEAHSFDMVMTNPPYMRQDQADRSPNAIRDTANVEGTADLGNWLHFALKVLKPKGTLVMIHRADRLDDILARLHGKLGEIAVVPLWPMAGREAKRIIIRGRKGLRGPARMCPGLALHAQGERYSEAATAILRDGHPMEI